MNSKWLHVLTFTFLIAGGLNWGIYGLFEQTNVVNMIFGGMPFVENLIYILVGLSAVYVLVMHKNDCTACTTKSKGKKK